MSDLELGDSATVTAITASNLTARQKLFSCGLVPGTVVTVIRRAPLGDPIQIQLQSDIIISIRKSEGKEIAVTKLQTT